jgi:hypothetical protein
MNQLLNDLAKLLKDISLYLSTVKPEPKAEQPKPVIIKPKTLEEIMAKYPHGWCEGNLEDRRAMMALKNKVCREEGLSLELTADLHATIWGESGWNQYCVNTDSKDYGLCQFSLRYYCKEYNMTPAECLLNPEKQLRIMARNFKAGRQKNWVAYQPESLVWRLRRTKGL